ncbi:radical SAM protein [Candidatus Daviesbacteria bacterium]|nr:radical SAM protein [Candidatus Daviesbacteria bacterium]
MYTKEGIPFYDHTLAAVEYAAKKRMLVGIATNGDDLTRDKTRALRKSGLLSMTLSLHTETKKGLDHLIKGGRMAAEEGIIPTIQVVATSQTADSLPGIAAYTVENGILISATVVQEKGVNFSAVPTGESLVPSLEQLTTAYRGLRGLKKFGLVRNNRNFLSRSDEYFPNRWKCDPEKDHFIHIGAGGTIDVCQEVRTNLTFDDISGLKDPEWRKQKEALVEECNCLYQCYFEASNPDIKGDLTTIGVALLIRNGGAGLVRKWGQFAADRVKRLEPDIDWTLSLN